MSASVDIQGYYDPSFAAVAEAFLNNLSTGGEIGAAFCVMHGGAVVVDIWGGFRDQSKTTPWTADTLINVWSSTKGINATAFAMLVDRGLLSYDDPVAKFWPEFAAQGKGGITVGQLLSHQAGLSGFTTPAEIKDLYGGASAASRLAAQAPIWEPGTASGYHSISIGILSAELFKRIEGRTLAAFIADEIAAPHGLDLRLGLPLTDTDRAGEMIAPATSSSATGALTAPQIAALANPPLDPRLPNTAEWRAAELSSANGFVNARALAGLYARLIPGGVGGRRLVSEETMNKATEVQIDNTDLVLNLRARWGAGFLLNTDSLYGPGEQTFGHSGWGGSFGFGDPEAKLAVGYAMNVMSQMPRGDARGQALIVATYGAL